MAEVAGSGGGGGYKKNGYTRYAAGTRWAYFSKIPTGISGTNKVSYAKGRWVRVGSPTWKTIQRFNGAMGRTHPHLVEHPHQLASGRWNPESGLVGVMGRQAKVAPNAGEGVSIHSPVGAREGTGSRGPADPNAPGANQRARVAAAGDTKTSPPPKDPKSTQRIAAGNQSALQTAIGSTKVGSMIPRSYARALANMQYGSAINDTRLQLANLPKQNAQDLRDISDWYGQAQAANAQAGQQDAGLTNTLAGAQDNATARILQAIGGSSNQNAGAVGAAGDEASALMRSLGAVQQQYHNDMTPAMAQAQAGASAAMQAQDNQTAQQYHQQLADLLQQRGAAQKQSIMDIIAQNLSTSQQRFTDRVAKLQAVLGGETTMGNLSLIPLQAAGLKARNAGQRQANKTAAATSTSGHIGWNMLNANQQNALAQQWMAGPNNTAALYATALARAKAQGYTIPAVANYLQTLYQQ